MYIVLALKCYIHLPIHCTPIVPPWIPDAPLHGHDNDSLYSFAAVCVCAHLVDVFRQLNAAS